MPTVTVTSTTDDTVTKSNPTTMVTVSENETASGNFTNTYLGNGALKITKLVRINGAQPTPEQYSQVEGSYIFSVVGPASAQT